MKYLQILLSALTVAVTFIATFAVGAFAADAPTAKADWQFSTGGTLLVRFELFESFPGSRDIEKFEFTIKNPNKVEVLGGTYDETNFDQLLRNQTPNSPDLDKTVGNVGANGEIEFPNKNVIRAVLRGDKYWFEFDHNTNGDWILEYTILGRPPGGLRNPESSSRAQTIRVGPAYQEQLVMTVVIPNHVGNWDVVISPSKTPGLLKKRLVINAGGKSYSDFKTPKEVTDILGGASYNKAKEIITGDSVNIKLRDTNEENQSGKSVNRVALALGHAHLVPVVFWYRWRCKNCSADSSSDIPEKVTQIWIEGVHVMGAKDGKMFPTVRSDLKHPTKAGSYCTAEDVANFTKDILSNKNALRFLSLNADRNGGPIRTIQFGANQLEGPESGQWEGKRYKLGATAPYYYQWNGGVCDKCNF